VAEAIHSPRFVRFGTFEIELPTGEIRKGGLKVKLTGQPFQVLAILLERPGQVVTREELHKRLWPDTFVDVELNLNTAINKIREVLGDSAESPRFVETLPRRGYRFIAPVEGRGEANATDETQVISKKLDAGTLRQARARSRTVRYSLLAAGLVLLVASSFVIYRKLPIPVPSPQRTLTRVTFDEGLQIGTT
jgi:DNA-binding winged helix-turn-helix (wHTH) protein